MKLNLLLTLLTCLHVSARGVAQVTVSARNEPLLKVIRAIEKQTEYDFIFSYDFVEKEGRVTVDVRDVSVESALEAALQNTSLDYSILTNTVVIRPKAHTEAQQPTARNITGLVTGPDGRPIVGATVVVKGTTRGAASDANGHYTIVVGPQDEILEFSYLGMKKRETFIGNRTEVNIELEEQVSAINEVQVIAYGTTTRKLNTGSVSTIKKDVLEAQPVANVLNALQGRVNGMYISPQSSTPGSNPNVTVRGVNSFRVESSNQAPLFVLDGVPIPFMQKLNSLGVQSDYRNGLSTLLNINPLDIESVDVLKDADAAALYGSRGANGVVLITTKKGAASRKLTVNVNAYMGFAKFPRFIDMWGADEYIAARKETMANDGLTPTEAKDPDIFVWDKNKTTDWQRELFGGTASTNNINFSVSGGSRNTTFYINGGYRTENTVMTSSTALTNKTARLNLNHYSEDGRFNINVIAGIGQNKILLPSTSLLMKYYDLPAHYPAYNEDGTPNWDGGREYPFASLLEKYTAISNSYNAKADLSYEVWNGLRLKLSSGVNSMMTEQATRVPTAAQNPKWSPQPYMVTTDNKDFGWILEPQLTYNGSFRKHTVSALLGGTWEKSYRNAKNVDGFGFTNDAMMTSVYAANNVTSYEDPSEYAYASFFARVTYHYDEKYLLNVSYRRDGSSRFGPDKKFGNFGAVGAAWVFSSEAFVKDNIPFLSFGKLRASYGVLGSDNIGDYQYASIYKTYSSGTMPYDGVTLRPSSLANPSIGWEENRKLDIGLELGFMDDRFWVSANWYRNRTDNQLLSYAVSGQSGFTSYLRNFPALVQNTGWEFELSSRNIETENFRWETRVNFSWSNNKLVEFPDIEQTSYFNKYYVGKSLNIVKAYKCEGINNEGIPIIADLDGSGSITSSGDMYVVGNSDPRFGGMTNTFAYKDIELSFFIQYERVFGVDNTLPQYMSPVRAGRNMNDRLAGRWQKPGDEATATYPRLTGVSSFYNYSNYRSSDVNVGATNIFRLTNLSLRYTFPREWTAKAKIERLQVYVLGQNLYTWDKLRKYRFDPATGNATMPQLCTWTFGINCTF